MALVVARTTLDADDELEFWLSRPVAERIAAVEVLRNRVFGGGTDATGPRLQRVRRVVPRASTASNSTTQGRAVCRSTSMVWLWK